MTFTLTDIDGTGTVIECEECGEAIESEVGEYSIFGYRDFLLSFIGAAATNHACSSTKHHLLVMMPPTNDETPQYQLVAPPIVWDEGEDESEDKEEEDETEQCLRCDSDYDVADMAWCDYHEERECLDCYTECTKERDDAGDEG